MPSKLQPLMNATTALLRDPRTYLRILYLLIAFPLGTAYFVIIVTGISVGFATAFEPV